VQQNIQHEIKKENKRAQVKELKVECTKVKERLIDLLILLCLKMGTSDSQRALELPKTATKNFEKVYN